MKHATWRATQACCLVFVLSLCFAFFSYRYLPGEGDVELLRFSNANGKPKRVENALLDGSYLFQNDKPAISSNSDSDIRGINQVLNLFGDSCVNRNIGAPVCPRLFILGAQKGGTTTLFHYLSRHPDFSPAWHLNDDHSIIRSGRPLKEVKYFASRDIPFGGDSLDQNTSRRLAAAQYLPHFESRTNPQQWSMDSSPSYMHINTVPTAMQKLGFREDPHVRFIILLRNPVDRAVSAMDRIIREKRPNSDRPKEYDLEEVVSRCIPLLNECRRKARENDGLDGLGYFYCRKTLNHEDMYPGMCEAWNRGFYADALRAWLMAGYDGRKQFCILSTSKLFDGPDALIKETNLGRNCLAGSGVDLQRFPDWENDVKHHNNVHNTTEKLRSAGLSPTSAQLVEDFYAEANIQLFRLLHEEFGVEKFTF